MQKAEGLRVTAAVERGAVCLRPAGKTGGFRVSPRGQFELRAEARTLLESGKARHFWVRLGDADKVVRLVPYA